MEHSLDFRNGEALRKLLQRNEASKVRLELFHDWTLGGMIELYFSLLAHPSQLAHLWNQITSDDHYRDWNSLNQVYTGTQTPSLRLDSLPARPQFFRLDSPDICRPNSHLNLCFSEFQQQFVRVAKNAGFQSSFARAQVAIMQELADNVFQHSGLGSNGPLSGVVGFHAEKDYLSISIADAGIGIWKSLRSSTQWASLESEQLALRAVIYQHASRKAMEQGEGEGFKQLIRGLVDRHVQLTIRTCDAKVRVRQVGDARSAEFSPSPYLQGVHLSMVTNVREGGGEKSISNT